MHYLIQENLFKERNYNLILDHLDKLGLTYDIVSIIPYTDIVKKRKENDSDEFIDFETNHKNIFCFGSVKFAHISKRYEWFPGSMYNDNHDYQVYSKFYKDHLLNSDCLIQGVLSPIPDTIPDMFFARPCKDTKLFTGGVFMRDSWYEMVEHLKVNSERNIEYDSVMFSKIKNISYETRCWVVGGEVITMSEYKRGRFVTYKNVDDNLYLKDDVKKLVDMYQPADSFVIDVCETVEEPGVLKVVEINCINCSGFYEANMQKVIDSLNQKFTI